MIWPAEILLVVGVGKAICMAIAVHHISNDELRFLGEERGGATFHFIGLWGLSFSSKRTLWFLVFHIYPLTFVTSMVDSRYFNLSYISSRFSWKPLCYILFTY